MLNKNKEGGSAQQQNTGTTGGAAAPAQGQAKVKTPGGVLTLHNTRKQGTGTKCGDCGKVLQGLPALRPCQLRRVAKNKKQVARAYGGSRCATCVRERIVRAFLIEEQKIVKQVLKQKKKEA